MAMLGELFQLLLDECILYTVLNKFSLLRYVRSWTLQLLNSYLLIPFNSLLTLSHISSETSCRNSCIDLSCKGWSFSGLNWPTDTILIRCASLLESFGLSCVSSSSAPMDSVVQVINNKETLQTMLLTMGMYDPCYNYRSNNCYKWVSIHLKLISLLSWCNFGSSPAKNTIYSALLDFKLPIWQFLRFLSSGCNTM